MSPKCVANDLPKAALPHGLPGPACRQMWSCAAQRLEVACRSLPWDWTEVGCHGHSPLLIHMSACPFPPLPRHFQGKHLQFVQLVTISQIFPLSCYQENLCRMNFCFITLLKQIHSKQTCGIPLQSNPVPRALSLFFLLKRKPKKCQIITHCIFQMYVLFSVLLLTMGREAGLLI